MLFSPVFSLQISLELYKIKRFSQNLKRRNFHSISTEDGNFICIYQVFYSVFNIKYILINMAYIDNIY